MTKRGKKIRLEMEFWGEFL